MRGIPIDADTLRRLRKARAWSQERLAAVAGCSTRTVRNAERGKPIDTETVALFAEALETTLHTLAALDNRELDRERNIKLVRQWHEAHLCQDVGALLSMHHRDSHTEIPGTEGLPGGGAFHGLAEQRSHYEIVNENFPTIDMTAMPIDAVGDLVYARPVATIHALHTGERYTQPHVNVFRLVDGKVRHRITYMNLVWHRQNAAHGSEP